MSLGRFFASNIGNKGRLIRAVMAVALFVAAAFGFKVSVWIGVPLLVAGLVGVFEALHGWCALRACGIRTKF
jgi:hypothetical protein